MTPTETTTTAPPVPPRPSFATRLRKGVQIRPIQILLLLFVVSIVIFGTWYTFFKTSTKLDGCFDSKGNVYSVLDANGASVDSSRSQCQTCAEIVNITNPADPSSFMTAMFCDVNAVYSLNVHNPPTPIAQVPMPFMALVDLALVGFHDAVYGDSILNTLLESLQNPTYFQILNVTASASATKVLNGTMPPLPPGLARKTSFFSSFGATNQNLSGPIPPNYADSLAFFNVSNNPLLSGPLPSSINTDLTSDKNPQWTQTRGCQFQNTQLCIPDGWAYQPSCIRDMAFSLPMCAIGAMQATINPKEPTVLDKNGWTFNRGGGMWTQQIAILSIMFVIFVMWTMVWLRRRRILQAQVEADLRDDDYYSHVSPERRREDIEMQLRREDDMNLPTYMPPPPGYSAELRDETSPKGGH
ncbi:hypothetical protein HDU98_007616 [Podochytrium sp. JEL0797]|nr:hypothetical protein HDU98_007616 [Podochytrium sp. JEL0797]